MSLILAGRSEFEVSLVYTDPVLKTKTRAAKLNLASLYCTQNYLMG